MGETLKFKIEDRVDKAKFELRKVGMWITNHKEEILICTPMVLGAFKLGRTGINYATKRMEIRAEDRRKHYRVYDPNTGAYLFLKRPLTNKENYILATRASGITVTEILHDLDLLK